MAECTNFLHINWIDCNSKKDKIIEISNQPTFDVWVKSKDKKKFDIKNFK